MRYPWQAERPETGATIGMTSRGVNGRLRAMRGAPWNAGGDTPAHGEASAPRGRSGVHRASPGWDARTAAPSTARRLAGREHSPEADPPPRAVRLDEQPQALRAPAHTDSARGLRAHGGESRRLVQPVDRSAEPRDAMQSLAPPSTGARSAAQHCVGNVGTTRRSVKRRARPGAERAAEDRSGVAGAATKPTSSKRTLHGRRR